MIIDLTIVLILIILAIVFTFLIFLFKQMPDKKEEGLPGFAWLSAIVAFVLWIIIAVVSANVGYTVSYATVLGEEIVTGTLEVQYNNTQYLPLVFGLCSVIPFVLTLFLFPETWKKQKS